MKAVMPQVSPDILAMRKRTGAHYWDEMWEGVLHMAPVPNRVHQELAVDLHHWLRQHWARPQGNRVYPPINIASPGGWPNDYRIPDLVLLTPDRFHIDRNEYFEGAPTVVVEVRSPGDESIEKLPFYAKLGVPEVWVIDRDTKVPELYVLKAEAYENRPQDADGWLKSNATSVWLCGQPGAKLAVQMADAPETRRLLPED